MPVAASPPAPLQLSFSATALTSAATDKRQKPTKKAMLIVSTLFAMLPSPKRRARTAKEKKINAQYSISSRHGSPSSSSSRSAERAPAESDPALASGLAVNPAIRAAVSISCARSRTALCAA